jgi:hypothetical protein
MKAENKQINKQASKQPHKLKEKLCGISGSHSDEYEYGCLLGCCDRPDDGGTKHL